MDSKPFNRKKILVIDDDSDARELLCSLLELNGYLVACAENGQVALDNIEADEIPPALILLDLVMPVMDGRSFLARVRGDRILAEVPILVVTGEIDPQVPEASAVVAKSAPPHELLSLVRRWLR